MFQTGVHFCLNLLLSDELAEICQYDLFYEQPTKLCLEQGHFRLMIAQVCCNLGLDEHRANHSTLRRLNHC
ncbi:unnamed protein product [Peronospora belbahrii]|uniref:Uncharacterized protein n=1 Tax=Peronospora belbahrii TaxID=622444 RepID=A0AAU9KL75_9STRA|nr:unnamed protein product [Peronospora belbahrii]